MSNSTKQLPAGKQEPIFIGFDFAVHPDQKVLTTWKYVDGKAVLIESQKVES